MIEFACHTWAFTDLTLPEALGTIARLGFRYVDIGSGPHLNAARAAADPQRIADEIRHDLTIFNLKLSDLYILLPRISLADEEKRRQDIDLFKALLPFMTALETPGVTLSAGLVHSAEDEEAEDRTIAALREMVKAAQAVELAVSIEPHLDSMAATPETALRFIEQVKGLQITLDWAQMMCQGIKDEALQSLLPHTRHVQIRSAGRNKLQTPFNKNRIDIDAVMAMLRDADYAGVVSVEYMRTSDEQHGMQAVNTIRESVLLRDALRDARDALQPA